MSDRSGGVFWVSRHLIHDIRPSTNNFWKFLKKSKSGLRSGFFLLKLHFACQNAFFVHVEWFNEPSDYVLQTNPRSQKDYGSLSKTSRARFFILFLVFEKINFFRSHEPECSKISLNLYMSWTKNGFVGWWNSIFSNSFKTFLNDIGSVWGCLLGLKVSHSRY